MFENGSVPINLENMVIGKHIIPPQDSKRHV